MNIKCSDHPHPLILKTAPMPYFCDGCKQLGFSPCYQCDHENCHFYIHEECANASSYSVHPFFEDCDFEFYTTAPVDRVRWCDACGKNMKEFRYQCTHKKAHDLHPCCLKLEHTLEGDGFTLHLTDKAKSRCLWCKSKKIMKYSNGWSYVSSCGEYSYHVACVKDMVFREWKNGYFNNEQNDATTGRLSMAVTSVAPTQKVVAISGSRSSNKGKVRPVYLEMAKLVLELIISAIFGGPIGLISVLAETLLISLIK